MKALILNAGRGTRMGQLTEERSKCLTELSTGETILGRQLRLLGEAGVHEVVITTGFLAGQVEAHCQTQSFPGQITFVRNPLYESTNYIYSIACAQAFLDDDILLLHGDLVFEPAVLDGLLSCKSSCMVIDSTVPLPQKDFKAVLQDGYITAVGVDRFQSAVAAMPLYKLNREDWLVWLGEIATFCQTGETGCYAENAFNQVSDRCRIVPLDIRGGLCAEIDTQEDLRAVSAALDRVAERTVYMSFSTDLLHSGHISIIKKAQRLGKLTIGVLTDEAVASYKRFPLVPFTERKAMLESIAGVARVVEQRTLSYRENLERYQPDLVVHGDDWVTGKLQPVREETIATLNRYGGRLVEFPYSMGDVYQEIERRMRAELSLPDMRRARLKKVLALKGFATAMEAHSGLTGLIVEETVVNDADGAHQFDAMWVSSLCDSTAKGKPDIEVVDMTSRLRTIDDIMEVTTKPIIFDGDTGGLAEHFSYTVRTLERMGVSMVIIEDKIGLKKNSLFGTDVPQTQDSIEHFSAKIAAGKRAQKTADFMICARIESLILEKGLEDALERAFAFVQAGADAIMIHSRKREPNEIFQFVERFRAGDAATPLVVVPTSFHTVTEEEFKRRGVNIVIYANQLTRSGFPAMRNAAESILTHHRAKECDALCMSIQDILALIPEEI
ncbi:MAG: phosphoenolpyruvate mutase [Lawsonibacter sp.]|nr:phosphoenolpyruvate mutase [Lawsonibacter sp.]